MLAWWDKHKYDTVGTCDGDEYNGYDEPPEFVRAALAPKEMR